MGSPHPEHRGVGMCDSTLCLERELGIDRYHSAKSAKCVILCICVCDIMYMLCVCIYIYIHTHISPNLYVFIYIILCYILQLINIPFILLF